MTVKDYRELRWCQSACETAMAVFECSKAFPYEERYSLTDQLRRASCSVSANLAEAWRKRRYPAHFVSKLSAAESEAAEYQVWLAFARECGYLDAFRCPELTDRYDHVCSQANLMMREPQRWALKPFLTSEAAPRSTLSRS